MEPVLFIFLAVALFGIIALLAWYFSADQRALRAMRAVPYRRIADVIDGEKARIVGQVALRETVRAPLSGRECAYWRVTVREQRGGGKSRHWVTIIDEHGGVDFFLEQDGAKALIKTDLVTAVLQKDGSFSSGFLNDATPELEAFLAERGHSAQGWVFNKNLRYHEGVVEHGETVCVVGVGHWERDPDEEARAGSGYRDAQHPKRLVMKSPDEGPLQLTDRPDGALAS